jgi:thiamine-monophosphate kinase
MRKAGSNEEALTERGIISAISRIVGERLDDDCAYMRVGRTFIALTVDSISESTHVPKRSSPEDIGWYASAVSLSDLASSGAEPVCLLLSVVAPWDKRGSIPSIVKGAMECASAHSTRILGGDTKQGESLVLTSVGVGRTSKPVTRSGARPGDSIYVTGRMGGCAAGFLEDRYASGRKRVLRIRPRTNLASLVRSRASACIDLSDGLVTSLYHIARASGCGMMVDLSQVPLERRFTWLTRKFDDKERIAVAANFGGDYELLFTSSARVSQLERGVRITKIGRVVRDEGVVDMGGQLIRDEGYEHFSSRWLGSMLRSKLQK